MILLYVVCLPFGISTSRLRNIVNYVGWSKHIEKFRFGFQSFEECKFSSVRINRSQICEIRVISEDAECVYLDPYSLRVPLLSEASVFKLSVSYTLRCWVFCLLQFQRVEWHSMEKNLDFNSNSSNK